VDILDGTLRVGTPLCVVKVDPVTSRREVIDLGKMWVLFVFVLSDASDGYASTALRLKSTTRPWTYVSIVILFSLPEWSKLTL
jgi:hypothetical protein